MLYIIFGATRETGYKVREHFKSQNYQIIKKYCYKTKDETYNKAVQDNKPLQELLELWHSDWISVNSQEEIQQCDYWYNVENDLFFGFNTEQILDAVQNKTDAVMTVVSSTMEFAEKLKKQYKNVRVLFLYSDTPAYVDESGYKGKISTSIFFTIMHEYRIPKETYINNVSCFDTAIIYNGRNTTFDFTSLILQMETYIKKLKA